MLPVKPAIVSSASDYVTTKEAQAKKNWDKSKRHVAEIINFVTPKNIKKEKG
jgi:hypothetical protein